MRKVFALFCMAMMATSGMAQNSYIVKTKGVKKTEVAKSGSESEEKKETDEPTDFIGKNFKYQRLCDWKEGMRFMVMPEKYDLVVGAFCDAKSGKDVSCGSLRYKIMEYKGNSVLKDNTAIINFHCVDNGKDYYYPIPNGTFDDYCYNKMGVPTLAYLGDVDTAREKLMGSTIYTKANLYRVDTEYDGDGFQEVSIPEGTEVKVVAIGVGTRSFPVKIIVEDKDGMQFYQNVAMSKTNSGMRDDEFIMDKAKFTFYGSFDIDNPNAAKAQSYDKYIGRQVYTKYQTVMTNHLGLNVTVPRLSNFTIKKVEAQVTSNYVRLSLQSASDGYQYTKDVTFKNNNVAGDIDGYKEDYYNYLFGDGHPGKNIPASHMQLIQKGKVARGFTKEEVRLAKGKPRSEAKNSKGIVVWTYSNGSVVRFNKNGRVI